MPSVERQWRAKPLMTFRWRGRLRNMRGIKLAIVILAGVAPLWAQTGELKTSDAVLERYKVALGGVNAIAKVQSMTVRGEVESASGKAAFIYYAKPFKTLFKVTKADGSEVLSGFDGNVSWSITPEGPSIDKSTAIEAVRRDADLQYALHQPDYFKKLELAGVTDFEGHRCYWLHGTTHWGKDNNQFYDVETGLLRGYRFEADDASKTVTIAVFEDYKNFGGPLVATKHTFRTGTRSQTLTFKSVSYEPVVDSVFELPQAVKAQLNNPKGRS